MALMEKSGNARNQLLNRLPRSDFKRLQPHLEPVPFHHRQVLVEAGRQLQHVIFPQDGVVSLLSATGDSPGIEVAMVGVEGMIGLPLFLGDRHSLFQALVQVPGDGLRMKVDVLHDEIQRRGALHELLGRYSCATLAALGRGSDCNALHTVKQRCCRWLLTMHDRARTAAFPMTQEFLAQMLGVRRASVAEVAGILQRAHLIQSSRGTIAIANRRGIEALACDCFRDTKGEFDRLLPPAD